MAKEKIKQEAKAEEVEGEPPKKKGGRLKLIVLLLLLAGGGGGAAWYFTQPEHGKAGEHEKSKEKAKPPVFERLEAFTVNLSGEGEHYLQVEISLKVSDAKIGEDIKLYMPEIRDRVLRLLSSKHADELATPQGKAKLSEEIKAQVNKPLNLQAPGEGVVGVFFTSFVIQ
jgi:flagellar FliL protein